jgi:hypothetical protein
VMHSLCKVRSYTETNSLMVYDLTLHSEYIRLLVSVYDLTLHSEYIRLLVSVYDLTLHSECITVGFCVWSNFTQQSDAFTM